ncbi:MAG: hypothetical protein MJ158_02880 [Alphaproteobacteria bacterium]|nr:hypothetical protein [Alphaproteobacteria bacterium]
MSKTITPKSYISLSEKGAFIGNKPCIKYNNQNFTKTDVKNSIKKFLSVKKLVAKEFPKMELRQVHILLSTTDGKYDENFDPAFNTGTPEPFEYGLYGWCRIVVEHLGKNFTSDWTFYHYHDSEDNLYSTTFLGFDDFFYFFETPNLRKALFDSINKQCSLLTSVNQRKITQKLMRRYLQKHR